MHSCERRAPEADLRRSGVRTFGDGRSHNGRLDRQDREEEEGEGGREAGHDNVRQEQRGERCDVGSVDAQGRKDGGVKEEESEKTTTEKTRLGTRLSRRREEEKKWRARRRASSYIPRRM